MPVVDEIQRYLTPLRDGAGTQRSDESLAGAVGSSGAAQRVELLSAETQQLVLEALRDCTGALNAFKEYDSAFAENAPDNFRQRTGESDEEFLGRRTADREYWLRTHPGREGRRQEAGVAYRQLPACEQGLLALLDDSSRPEGDITEYAENLQLAATATRAIINGGIDHSDIELLRRAQILGYGGMSDVINGPEGPALDGASYDELMAQRTTSADLYAAERNAQVDYVVHPGSLPSAPQFQLSLEQAKATIASSWMAAIVNAEGCAARVTDVLHPQHVAEKSDRVVIQLLYGNIPGTSAAFREHENQIVTESDESSVGKYNNRYRTNEDGSPGEYSTWRQGAGERPAAQVFTVYLDAGIDWANALPAELRRRALDGENGPNSAVRVNAFRFDPPEAEHQFREALENLTSRSELVLSAHGSSFQLPFLNGSQIADFLRLPRDAHCHIKLDACRTAGDPRIMAKYPGVLPLSEDLHEKLRQNDGPMCQVTGYTRRIVVDSEGHRWQKAPTVSPAMELLNKVRGLVAPTEPEPDERKVPGTKVQSLYDPVRGERVRREIGHTPSW